MIRNAVIHMFNEQPLLADLFEMPAAADVGLVCTNLRTLNGKRPVFVDHIESIFLMPLSQVRFLEIPPGAEGGPAVAVEASAESGPAEEPEGELELDEDFLRRVKEL